MTDQEAPELMRVSEAAALMSVSRSKAYEMAARREIPTVALGKSVRVPRRRLLAWLEQNTRGGEPTAA